MSFNLKENKRTAESEIDEKKPFSYFSLLFNVSIIDSRYFEELCMWCWMNFNKALHLDFVILGRLRLCNGALLFFNCCKIWKNIIVFFALKKKKNRHDEGVRLMVVNVLIALLDITVLHGNKNYDSPCYHCKKYDWSFNLYIPINLRMCKLNSLLANLF